MTDEDWHKPDGRYRTFDNDGNKVIVKCPTCASTDLVQAGWTNATKREKLLQCQNCGTKF